MTLPDRPAARANPGAVSRGATSAGPLPAGFRPKGFALVLSGPSGVGKSSVCQHLMASRDDVVFSVSATTRPRREGEVHGREYWFYDEAEFRRRVAAGEFVEHAEVHGRLYGTPRAPLERELAAGSIVLLDVDIQGGRSLRRAFPDGVFVFVYPPSLAALEERLRARASDSEDVIETRLAKAPEEMSAFVEYDYLVVNNELEQASRQVAAIVEAERARLTRLEPPGRSPRGACPGD